MWPRGFDVNTFGTSDASCAPEPDLGREFFVSALIVLVAVIGGIILLTKAFGGKVGGPPIAAAGKAAIAFSPWFPVR